MCEFDCNACEHDPELKKFWGCEGPSQGVVWDDGFGETFYNCPSIWITDDIIEWFRSYLYATEISSVIAYSDRANKWVEAWLVYRAAFNQYQSYQMEKKYSKGKGDDLDAMGAHLYRQKRGK